MLGPEHPDTLGSLNNLAVLYWNQGKYEQAEPLYQRALEAQERVLGPEHPNTLGTVNNLAILYWNQGKYEQAEPLYQRALAIREQVFGTRSSPHGKSSKQLCQSLREDEAKDRVSTFKVKDPRKQARK